MSQQQPQPQPQQQKCEGCKLLYEIDKLKLDTIFPDKLICDSCYYNRVCENCWKVFCISDMIEGDYNSDYNLVCKECSKYPRQPCESCNKMFYVYELPLTEYGEVCEECEECEESKNNYDNE